MSLKIRFRFEGRCSTHPRYNPEKDGRPQHENCPGCDSLWVIHLYSGIARRKAEMGNGILVAHPESHRFEAEPAAPEQEDPAQSGTEQTSPNKNSDTEQAG